MNIITIAVTPELNQRDDGTYWVEPEHAPVWTDGTTDYLVSSGLSDEPLETSDPITAQADRVNVVVGMEGLDALAAMGLTVKEAVDGHA